MISVNKTFLSNQKYENRNWFLIDCKNQRLGRLTTVIVTLLKGKNKPYYYPSIDTGDYVILTNVKSIIINKANKHYLVNTPGRPGHSLKVRNVVDSLPKFTIEKAVKGMLSKTETKRIIKRLNIYETQTHPHSAQNPIKINPLSNPFLNKYNW